MHHTHSLPGQLTLSSPRSLSSYGSPQRDPQGLLHPQARLRSLSPGRRLGRDQHQGGAKDFKHQRSSSLDQELLRGRRFTQGQRHGGRGLWARSCDGSQIRIGKNDLYLAHHHRRRGHSPHQQHVGQVKLQHNECTRGAPHSSFARQHTLPPSSDDHEPDQPIYSPQAWLEHHAHLLWGHSSLPEGGALQPRKTGELMVLPAPPSRRCHDSNSQTTGICHTETQGQPQRRELPKMGELNQSSHSRTQLLCVLGE
jgi:hypothetical protein